MASNPLASPTLSYPISNFTFHNGTTLPSIHLAYQILNPQSTKIAVVHTCFRGTISSTITHATSALRNHKIIVIALLGNGESSSPSNTPDFPATIQYMDCVAAGHRLLVDGLGVRSVDVMLGFSMGGQLTYHFLATHPSFIRNAIIVCSSARTSAHNVQFLEGPRAALECAADAQRGLRAFGKAYSAWLTSAEWFDGELWTELGFESREGWDEVVTRRNYEDWDRGDLLALLGMWQRGDISRCAAGGDEGAGKEGSLQGALAGIEARVLLMPCETDQYFRPYVSQREAMGLRHARVDVVKSVWGHIVGGGACKEDLEWMDGRIKAFLEG